MQRSRVPSTCAVASSIALALVAAPLATAAPSTKPAATTKPTTTAAAVTNAWQSPVAVGEAPANVQAGIVTRVGLTTNGKGTVAWNAGGSTPTIATRDFTVGGTLGPSVNLGAGSLVSSVARDRAGNAVIAGQTASTTPFTWAAARTATGTSWTLKTLASGPYVSSPAAFGLKAGFLIAQTSSFIPTTTAQGTPTAAAFGVTPDATSIALGKPLEAVETGDFSHGADGSNWATTSTGHAVTTGRRELGKPAKGKAPKSVAALVRVGKAPSRNTIEGVERFGGGAVTAVGARVAVAGLEVQQTNELAVRGVPVVAQGAEDDLGEAVAIEGVPARRALEVDVAGRAGGGAVVTWLQQTSSTAENLLGQPKWAIVDEDGEVTDQGDFSSASDARDLRVIRAGSSELAVWIRGEGDSARWYAATISGDTVRSAKAPAGTPVGRLEGNLNTSQLSANGRQVALSFVDRATDTVRVATQTLK